MDTLVKPPDSNNRVQTYWIQQTEPGEILNTKLQIPRLPTRRVRRAALLERLETGKSKKLTLLSAPAGSGKTTLATEWIQNLKKRAAWVSLGNGDNDPQRFWRYVLTAVRILDQQAGQAALEQLQNVQAVDYDALVTAFVNPLASSPDKFVLVLEDYHFIRNDRIHAAVAFLLDHLPPALHLVLITRSDPPLPLARLRAQNEINELRAPDLRFSKSETETFLLQTVPYPLSTETIAQLAGRTEGWAAGLRLAALALQGRPENEAQEHFLATFAGSHRPLVDYLVTEVLEAQSESLQAFLLETSLLERLTAPLCEALTGRNDSGSILDQLERANLFLEPLDGSGQWYRFHGLFAEALRYAAHQRLGTQHLQQLAQRASKWYETNGMGSEAVEMAFSAGTFERAARLIEKTLAPHLAGNEYHTLLEWIQKLPPEMLRTRPRLCLAYVQALVFTEGPGKPPPAERLNSLLEKAENCWEQQGNRGSLGEVAALRALIAARQGDYYQAYTLAREALTQLPESEVEWRGISLIFAGWGEFKQGLLPSALRSMSAARTLCRSAGNVYGVLNATIGLGEVYARRAEPQQAAGFFQQALDQLDSAPIEKKDKSARRARAFLGLANIAFERNDLDAAREAAEQAFIASEELHGEEVSTHAEWILARIESASGEIVLAQARLIRLAARTRQPRLLPLIRARQAWLALLAGDTLSAQKWAYETPDPSEQLPEVSLEEGDLIRARIQIRQGRYDEVYVQLNNRLEAAQERGDTRSELEIKILIALAERRNKNLTRAREVLAQALTTVQPEWYLRIFLDEGEPLAELLEEVSAQSSEKAIVERAQSLLLSYPAGINRQPRAVVSVPNTNNEALTLQEERVLGLLAARLTNPEIAAELVVSVNTVKTHVKGIFRKLNVNDRRAAVETARRLHLLS